MEYKLNSHLEWSGILEITLPLLHPFNNKKRENACIFSEHDPIYAGYIFIKYF